MSEPRGSNIQVTILQWLVPSLRHDSISHHFLCYSSIGVLSYVCYLGFLGHDDEMAVPEIADVKQYVDIKLICGLCRFPRSDL